VNLHQFPTQVFNTAREQRLGTRFHRRTLGLLVAVTIVTTVNASAFARGDMPWRPCKKTTASTLKLNVSGVANHEDDTTTTLVTLRTAEGKQYSHSLGGDVGCLAHSRAGHKYVLGRIGEMGAWRPLQEIFYLDEITGKLETSKALPPWADDKQPWCGFAAEASQDGLYVAFVAIDDSESRLEVLDTKEDRLLPVGEPPLPPPSAWARENVRRIVDFNWGMAEARTDGFIGMDSGILAWRGHVLEASYGKDGPSMRAKARKIRRWDLDKLAVEGRVSP